MPRVHNSLWCVHSSCGGYGLLVVAETSQQEESISQLMGWCQTECTHMIYSHCCRGRRSRTGDPWGSAGWWWGMSSLSQCLIRMTSVININIKDNPEAKANIWIFYIEDNYRRWGTRCLCCHERELRREMLEKFSIGPKKWDIMIYVESCQKIQNIHRRCFYVR